MNSIFASPHLTVTTLRRSLAVLCIAGLAASPTSAVLISDNFSTAASLDNYTQTAGRESFNHNSTDGWLVPTTNGQVSAWGYTNSIGTFNSLGRIELSVDFLTSSLTQNINFNAAGLGVTNSNSSVYAGSYTGFEMTARTLDNGNTILRFRNDGSGTVGQAVSDEFTLSGNAWHTLTFSIELIGTDLWVAGSVFERENPSSSLASITPTLAGRSFDNDAALFAGFAGGINGGPTNPDRGVAAIDNFLVAVPEPSTYALIFGGLALGFAGYWRRRKG